MVIAYILNVSPKNSAENPTIAGPKIKPENPMLDIWDIVIGIDSLVFFTASLKTIGVILEVKKPNKVTPNKIK